MLDEVEQMKKAKKKRKVKVCPDPLGSTLSDETSLQRLRKKCRISEEIVLVVPDPADRADAPPPGYFTLFENYFDQCLLWFPFPRERGVEISIEHLSCLLDFRVRGRRKELKYFVTNIAKMGLINGFPSKDDHFDGLKPVFLAIHVDVVTAMHRYLASRNGEKKFSSRQKVSLDTAEAARTSRSSGVDAPRAVALTTVGFRLTSVVPKTPPTLIMRPHHSLTPDEVGRQHEQSQSRALMSSGKGKDIACGTPSKRQMVNTSLAVVVEREASASCGAATSVPLASRPLDPGDTFPPLFLHLDRLVGDTMRMFVPEIRSKKEWDAKLVKLRSRYAKEEDEIALLKSHLSSAKIGGKAQTNILDLAEIDANLEFIELLQGPKTSDLLTEVKALRQQEVSAADVAVVIAVDNDDDVNDDEDGDEESDEEIDN
ncbi:hypothetical protein AALP_AAs74635U000300 [Arabis alpina]|uniref:Uncharacterized protein n=1 Tax=Arabis alpina TaxID=50452 RepID=A0A087G0B4_ARAAL|nr:hypothetical protein AALP_AAs74635U000300 [Arabis alpina]